MDKSEYDYSSSDRLPMSTASQNSCCVLLKIKNITGNLQTI